MTTQPTIFLLNGVADYELTAVLGVYLTAAGAEAALDVYKTKVLADIESCTYNHFEFDDYSITEFIIDAAAA